MIELDEKNFAGVFFDEINGKAILFRCPECKAVNGFYRKTLEKALKKARRNMRLAKSRHHGDGTA